MVFFWWGHVQAFGFEEDFRSRAGFELNEAEQKSLLIDDERTGRRNRRSGKNQSLPLNLTSAMAPEDFASVRRRDWVYDLSDTLYLEID